MIRHNEIWSASLKYADAHPSDYTNEMYDIVDIEKAFEAGAEWVDKTVWKPADGDYLPEIDREVVVFVQNFHDDAGIMKVAIAHRPNPNGWDGRNILTGEVDHYTPKPMIMAVGTYLM